MQLPNFLMETFLLLLFHLEFNGNIFCLSLDITHGIKNSSIKIKREEEEHSFYIVTFFRLIYFRKKVRKKVS